MRSFIYSAVIFLILIAGCGPKTDRAWLEDFKYQPVSMRPSLEVNHTDSSRTAFHIIAEEYDLTGQLVKPHLLKNSESGNPWLWMEMEDTEGNIYSTQLSEGDSRINLFRRGPYFCEVHWFDLGLATEEGKVAPLRGDLALYCYPEKVLAEIVWHATEDFPGKTLYVNGLQEMELDCEPFAGKTKQSFLIPLFNETEPLPDEAFETLVGEVPFRYSKRKGYYIVGTHHNSGSTAKDFYDHPNKYQTASFHLSNDSIPRKIYICHESVEGSGIIGGGVVLDEKGMAMPIVVQISKSFASTEEFYDPPYSKHFSETFFPLYLEPGESMTLTSLHLHQNWGRHMIKYWCSLAAWMDYFQSSTGASETTCYVPFKYAGIGGVAVADLRPMSQETFWYDSPQHDNIAGHGFLSFFDGKKWQHSKYESTIYRSTGPNWFDIQMNYTSADGSIKVTADLWETPQVDELRSFFKVRYEVLKPLVIDNPRTDFRLLQITSSIQRLRYTRFAANGLPDLELDPEKAPFPVKGYSLPAENIYLAEYGDSVRRLGSNAIIIRSFSGPEGITPAATVQWGEYRNRLHYDSGADTRLLLVPDADRLELEPGDVFEVDGYWLPYGPMGSAETPRRELEHYGQDNPSVTKVSRGSLISELPVVIKADGNKAGFSIKGGKDLIPVVIVGLTTWKHPRIWKKVNDNWRLLPHSFNTDHDGYQVFCDEEGTFGAVFLVHGDKNEQAFRVTAGRAVPMPEKIRLSEEKGWETSIPGISFTSPEGTGTITLHYPGAHSLDANAADRKANWKESEGQSLWMEISENGWDRGGRVSPNEDNLDLEYWWRHQEAGIKHLGPVFTLDVAGTGFRDADCERTWVLTSGGWQRASDQPEGARAVAVRSENGKHLLAMAWNNISNVSLSEGPGIILEPVESILNRRYHVRGKIYLVDENIEVLGDRINREMNIKFQD